MLVLWHKGRMERISVPNLESRWSSICNTVMTLLSPSIGYESLVLSCLMDLMVGTHITTTSERKKEREDRGRVGT